MRLQHLLVPALLLAAALLAGCADHGDRRNEAASDPPASGVSDVVAKDLRYQPPDIHGTPTELV